MRRSLCGLLSVCLSVCTLTCLLCVLSAAISNSALQIRLHDLLSVHSHADIVSTLTDWKNFLLKSQLCILCP